MLRYFYVWRGIIGIGSVFEEKIGCRGRKGSGMKVILHVDEEKKWKLALGNAKNLLRYGEEFGKEYNIEILANSAAVISLTQGKAKEDGLFADMEDLAIQAVKFVACRNALKANAILEGSLIPFVEVVPAGVAELVDKQNDGYAYVKP